MRRWVQAGYIDDSLDRKHGLQVRVAAGGAAMSWRETCIMGPTEEFRAGGRDKRFGTEPPFLHQPEDRSKVTPIFSSVGCSRSGGPVTGAAGPPDRRRRGSKSRPSRAGDMLVIDTDTALSVVILRYARPMAKFHPRRCDKTNLFADTRRCGCGVQCTNPRSLCQLCVYAMPKGISVRHPILGRTPTVRQFIFSAKPCVLDTAIIPRE